MKAVQIEEFGGPEVLNTAEIPTPEAGEDEGLIELRASGVNRSDILTRIGSYHAAGQPPIVPGFEGSGIVREPGPAATSISSDARVLAIGGRPGFYAEYVAVPTRHVVKISEDLDWDPARRLSPLLLSRLGTVCSVSPGFGAAKKYSSGRLPAASATQRCRSPSIWALRSSLPLGLMRRLLGLCRTVRMKGSTTHERTFCREREP
jgi:Zn-dependent alcohol dehydrogenase